MPTPIAIVCLIYNSCSSMGCDSVTGGGEVDYWPASYWDGWPSYGIDQPETQARAMGWMSFKYRTTGEYYYDTSKQLASAWKDCQVDVFDCIYAYGGNGDGTLFYPGTAEPKPSIGSPGIGGTHDIPLESMRMKAIRDGREDYLYLGKVPVEQRPDAMAIVDGLYPRMSDDLVTPAQLEAGRDEVAALVPADPIPGSPGDELRRGARRRHERPNPELQLHLLQPGRGLRLQHRRPALRALLRPRGHARRRPARRR